MNILYAVHPRQISVGEKLFVGNLPCNAAEPEIWSLFASFGTVLEVFCLGPNKSKSGQACAFVRFAEPSAAASAIHHLDGRVALRPNETPDLFLQVRPARGNGHGQEGITAAIPVSNRSPDSHSPCSAPRGTVRLFIGNLPVGTTTDELNQFFKSLGVIPMEEETFLMAGKSAHNNAICAFVVVRSDEDANRAISLMDSKVALQNGGNKIRVRVANQSTGQSKRPRSYSDSVASTAASPFNNTASAYGSGHYLMAEPVNWKEPSVKTYHHYMLMPQSSNYGPLHIIPGSEPWRNDGIYSLPPAFAPYMGH